MPRLLSERPQQQDTLRVGSITLDRGAQHLIFAGGSTLRLTTTKYKLLRCLMERPGEFVSADELLEQVWGYPRKTGTPEIVRAHVSNLRRKLRAAAQDPQLLRTLPYRGYGFAPAGNAR